MSKNRPFLSEIVRLTVAGPVSGVVIGMLYVCALYLVWEAFGRPKIFRDTIQGFGLMTLIMTTGGFAFGLLLAFYFAVLRAIYVRRLKLVRYMSILYPTAFVTFIVIHTLHQIIPPGPSSFSLVFIVCIALVIFACVLGFLCSGSKREEDRFA